jgi:TRAP-type C4-dicarboxylate transport system permease small subunit
MYLLYKKAQNAFIKIFFAVVYIATIIIPISMFLQVLARYFFKKPIAGIEELATAAFIWMVIFGSAILFKEKKHIIVDAFISKRSEKTKKNVELISNMLMMLILIILIYSCVIALPYQKFYKTVVLKIAATTHTKAFIVSLVFMVICCIENILTYFSGERKNA